MKKFILIVTAALNLGGAGAALAACVIGGISRVCDTTCTNTECTIATNQCDSGAADGYCVICGTGANENIQGTNLSDWICGKGGNDVINTFVSSSSTNGDSADGGGGDDELYGAAGNDDLRGDLGNDYISGGGGVDAVLGGAGADGLFVTFTSATQPGAMMCGGAGNDRLDGTAIGASEWVCMDCGADQSATGTDYDAAFSNSASGNPDSGSVRNCVNINPDRDDFFGAAPCGCE